MFEVPSASAHSSFSPRARAVLLGTAVSLHLALGGFVVVASVWTIVPLPAPEPVEAYISVSLPPLDLPVPPAPKPPPRASGGQASAPRLPVAAEPANATRTLAQPTTADLPTATTSTLDGPDLAIGSSDLAVGPVSGTGEGPGDGAVGGGDGEPIAVSGAVIAPVVVERVEPVYPPTALVVHRQGVVVVEAEIDTEGQVRAVRAVGPRLGFGLDESAMAAVRAWRFRPARLGERPVAVYFRLTVRFSLR